MKKMIKNSVILVSKDEFYKKAIAIVLFMNFNSKVATESEINEQFLNKYHLTNPDYMIVDLDTFNQSEIQFIKRFKKNRPATRFMALSANTKLLNIPAKIFQSIIHKNELTVGFSKALNKKTSGTIEYVGSELIEIEKKTAFTNQFANFFVGFIKKKHLQSA
jgi:hypothetical protein